jgi:peptide/nickel transport system permease protein
VFVVKRVLQGLISILGASIIIFTISRLSGDPIALLLPIEAPPSVIEQTRQQLGLDKPVLTQYFYFLGRGLSGDFGYSYRWQVPALQLILDRLPATIQLAVTALLFSVVIAIPFGVFAALLRGSWFDRFAKVFALLGQAMPNFWVGLMLILFFAVYLKWFPAFGRESWRGLVLPAIALGWYPVAAQTRIVRSAMLDVLDSDYVLMGRAMGVPEWVLVWKYALRNAAIPLVTIVGVYFAFMLGGSFVVEVIFAWPGVGRTVVEAVFARDFPVVQAGVMLTSVVFVVCNLLVDLSYSLIDPSIRHE